MQLTQQLFDKLRELRDQAAEVIKVVASWFWTRKYEALTSGVVIILPVAGGIIGAARVIISMMFFVNILGFGYEIMKKGKISITEVLRTVFWYRWSVFLMSVAATGGLGLILAFMFHVATDDIIYWFLNYTPVLVG